MKALKAIDTFDGSKDIRARLFTIAKNIYYTFYKQQNKYVTNELFDNTMDSQSNFEERLVDEENKDTQKVADCPICISGYSNYDCCRVTYVFKDISSGKY